MRPALLVLALLLAGCGIGSPEPRETRTMTIEVGPSAAQSGDRTGEGTPAPAGDAPPEVPGDDACDGAGEPTTQENLRQAEIAIRCLTNAVRRQEGVGELAFDERLARAAATRSSDMAEADFFGHQGPGSSSARNAVQRTGWIPRGKSWLLGENIGWAPRGSATPADLMRGWLDSPTHRSNLLSEDYTHIGVGAVAGVPKQDAEPGATFTQIFGVTGERARRAQTR